jgi:hypothetical protein
MSLQITDLNTYIPLYLYEWLDIGSLVRLMRTCRHFYEYGKHARKWKKWLIELQIPRLSFHSPTIYDQVCKMQADRIVWGDDKCALTVSCMLSTNDGIIPLMNIKYASENLNRVYFVNETDERTTIYRTDIVNIVAYKKEDTEGDESNAKWFVNTVNGYQKWDWKKFKLTCNRWKFDWQIVRYFSNKFSGKCAEYQKILTIDQIYDPMRIIYRNDSIDFVGYFGSTNCGHLDTYSSLDGTEWSLTSIVIPTKAHKTVILANDKIFFKRKYIFYDDLETIHQTTCLDKIHLPELPEHNLLNDLMPDGDLPALSLDEEDALFNSLMNSRMFVPLAFESGHDFMEQIDDATLAELDAEPQDDEDYASLDIDAKVTLYKNKYEYRRTRNFFPDQNSALCP